MKEGTRLGHGVKSKKPEKMPVDESEEKKFWDMGLLGNKTAQVALECCVSVITANGGEHRNICLSKFEIGD
jgi:hypothetical protein